MTLDEIPDADIAEIVALASQGPDFNIDPALFLGESDDI